MKMLLLAALLLPLAFHVPAAFALEDTRKELTEKLIELTRIRQNTEQVLDKIRQAQIAQLNGLNLPPEKEEKAKELQQKIFELLYEELNWENLKPEYVALYAATFSEEELRDMVDFYDSPSGRSLVDKMPLLREKSTALVRGRVLRLLPRIREIVREVVAGMREDGAGTRAAEEPPSQKAAATPPFSGTGGLRGAALRPAPGE